MGFDTGMRGKRKKKSSKGLGRIGTWARPGVLVTGKGKGQHTSVQHNTTRNTTQHAQHLATFYHRFANLIFDFVSKPPYCIKKASV